MCSKGIKQYETFQIFLIDIRFQIYDSINYYVKYELSSKEHNDDIALIPDQLFPKHEKLLFLKKLIVFDLEWFKTYFKTKISLLKIFPH